MQTKIAPWAALWLAGLMVFCLSGQPAMAQDAFDFFGSGEEGARTLPPTDAERVLPSGGDFRLAPDVDVPSPLQPQDASKAGDKPFGWELFAPNSAAARSLGVNPDYVIAPGDKVQVQVWGAEQSSVTLTVDLQGNVFLPEVGPVAVAGRTQNELNAVISRAISRVYTDRVQVYTNLLNTQPVGVYVTGSVERPGRYAGERTDSLIYFLQQAGGIAQDRGSFRDIVIKRGGREVSRVDLYEFLLNGDIPILQFQSDDIIVVGPQRATVQVEGAVRNAYRFELAAETASGEELQKLAQPYASASHIAVSGIRNNRPYNTYVPIQAFARLPIQDGDKLVFHADRVTETVFVSALGQSEGPSSYAVPRGATLDQILDMIPVDPRTAATGAIYLQRKSVAERQKRALERALDDLQRTSLTAPSGSTSEAQIRIQEAALIERFVQRARAVEPEGRVVLGAGGYSSNIVMEDGDVVVIPQKSNLVMISGEVHLPQTVVYRPGMELADYVQAAGGFTERANQATALVLRQSGEVVNAANPELRPGDHVMVMPAAGDKGMAITKDVVDIIYRIAVSSGVVLRLIF